MATTEANDNNNKSVLEMGYETTLVSYLKVFVSRIDFLKTQAATTEKGDHSQVFASCIEFSMSLY